MTSLEARDADGRTLAQIEYRGETKQERCRETSSFMKQHPEAYDFKHHGSKVWIEKNPVYKPLHTR